MVVQDPGLGGSAMWSPESASSGLSVNQSGGFVLGGGASRNLTDNSTSWQAGLSTPSVGVYTIKTNKICF